MVICPRAASKQHIMNAQPCPTLFVINTGVWRSRLKCPCATHDRQFYSALDASKSQAIMVNAGQRLKIASNHGQCWSMLVSLAMQARPHKTTQTYKATNRRTRKDQATEQRKKKMSRQSPPAARHGHKGTAAPHGQRGQITYSPTLLLQPYRRNSCCI